MNALKTKYSVSSLHGKIAALPCLLALGILALVSFPASAARVPGLYAAVVSVPEDAPEPLAAAFDSALSTVLVKVTGLPEFANKAVWTGLFANSASVVQQYSMQPQQQVRVQFDQGALQRVLDSSGFPVWDADRPLLAIWVALDAGGGRRQIIAASNDGDEGAETWRAALTEVADARGLPVVFPLADAEDLAQVSFADIWGDFQQPVFAASKRYGAEAVLLGRSRSADPSIAGVRWTLLVGGEVLTWQGDGYSGPAEAANLLARRLATFADSAGALRVLVKGVGTLENYGQLLKYFNSLSLVDEAGVGRISGNDVEFRIVVRGDAERLASKLAGSRLLVPLDAAVVATEFVRAPDLVYSWRQVAQGGS